MDIDIRAELEQFPWIRPRWTSDKLLAASPFRYDTHPSFFVRLLPDGNGPPGVWHDSGAVDPEWRSGGIVKLLAFLRQETIAETLDYLREKYGDTYVEQPDELPELRAPNLTLPQSYILSQTLDITVLDPYKWRSKYLGERGISEAVQRLMHVGYDRDRQAITLPWFNADGTLGNVMYRSVRSKAFWYASGGRRIGEMVYGINVVYRRKVKRAVIVEAPIDALTVMTAGIAAVAIGGTAFTAAKRDLILRSPLEEIVIMRDNDAPGRILQRKIYEALTPYMDVRIASIPMKYGKDANDCGPSKIRSSIERARCLRALTKIE